MLDVCGRYAIARKKYQKKKVTDLLYFTHAWVRPYKTGGDGSCTILEVTNVTTQANYDGYM
jgi:hypothetical protein